MPTAKVTSKGQITVPVEIRRSLGVGAGDLLAFEMKAGYAVVRRQKSLREVSDAAREVTAGRTARYESDDEAILSAFDDAGSEELSDRLLEISVAREDLE